MKLQDLREQTLTVRNTIKIDPDRKDYWDENLRIEDEGLDSFEGSPRDIGGNLFCDNNRLTSFEGCPEIVRGNVRACNNNFKDLKNIHKHLKEVHGWIWVDADKIKSHVLGLLLIDGLLKVICPLRSGRRSSWEALAIPPNLWMDTVNKYLPNLKGVASVYRCQSELIEKGLDNYAQL